MFGQRNFLFCLVMLLSIAAVSFATNANVTWDNGGGDSNWNTGNNWSTNTVPNTTSDYARINVAAGPVFSGQTATAFRVYLEGAGNGTITMNSGTLTTVSHIYMAALSTDTAILNMSGGTINIGSTSSHHLYCGQTGTAALNMSGGVINIGGTFYVARDASSVADVTLSGGTITCALLSLRTNVGAIGTINITGDGTLIFTSSAQPVSTYIANGWIKAYDGAGTVIVDTTTIPGKTILTAWNQSEAENPSPTNSAVNIVRKVTLSWTAGNGTTSHNVYLGTTNPPSFVGNVTAASFNPGTLDFDTTYYWRVDEVGSSGTLTGDVWSFSTVSGKSKNPDPVIGTTNVAINRILHWTPNSFAASHDVYLGTNQSDVTNANRLLGDLNGNGTVDKNDILLLAEYWLEDPAGTEPYAGVNDDNVVDFFDYAMFSQDWMKNANPVFKGNQDANSFDPGVLSVDTTYYWRVDEVNGPETAPGNVWSFSTQPAKAYSPNPAAGSFALTNATLTWTPGAGAASHDVYFGTANPPSFQGNQTSTTFNPGTLTNTTNYYWKVDEIGSYGTVPGDVWSFTTAPLNTTPIYQYLSWRNDPTNSVVVNWYDPTSTGDTTVDYGTTTLYGSTVINTTVTNFHHVELTGLTPGATYHYRPRSSNGTVGTDATYTVPPASTSSFNFAVFGDTRSTGTTLEPFYTRHQQLCNWILAQNYDFAIQGGDTVDEGIGSNASWMYQDFYRLESNLSKSKVIMATMGNHEVQLGTGSPPSIYLYYDLYTNAFPANGPAIDGKGRVYSFNYGNAHFVSLSSYQLDLATQGTWLTADLAAARANPNIKWIFVFFHAPMYTKTDPSTSRGDRTDEIAAWGPIFDTYHVDIVFQSHNHVYERSYSIKAGAVVANGVGTVYVTSGLGGAGFEGIGSQHPTFYAATYSASSTTYGSAATCVTIDGNTLTAQTITQNDGIVRDTFTLSK